MPFMLLSVPIFEWGKRRNEKRAASFQIGAATDNLHQVSDHVNLEVQTARVSLSQASIHQGTEFIRTYSEWKILI